MTEWQPMETAPRDGTAFQAHIPGHGSDNIIAWTDGLVDGNEQPCGGWQFVEDQEPPDCWTDGICWTENEDGEKSVEPTEWKALPIADGEIEREQEMTEPVLPAWVADWWKPIDTAPKDMKPILVFVRGSRIGDLQEEPDTIHIAYLKRQDTYVLQDEDHFIVTPTHWMPLPPNPPT